MWEQLSERLVFLGRSGISLPSGCIELGIAKAARGMSGPGSKRYTEADLKCLYLEHLRQLGSINANSVIASEYSLGRAGRRVDLAILNDEFVGVEFKSAYDSLKRLRQQLEVYVQCFDRVVLIVDDRHRANALFLKPPSVELWSASSEGKLSMVRPAKSRPLASSRALAQLCTIRELRRLATSVSVPIVSRGRLIDAAMQLPAEEIYQAATGSFRRAFASSSTAFWQALGPKEIDSEAMRHLSRFARERQKRRSGLKEQADFWQAWAEEAAATLGL